MIVTAWNNGRHHQSGAGYGLKIRRAEGTEGRGDVVAKLHKINMPVLITLSETQKDGHSVSTSAVARMPERRG